MQMDILQFRDKVKEILEKQGATFPSWDARLTATSQIAETAIDYATAFFEVARGEKS